MTVCNCNMIVYLRFINDVYDCDDLIQQWVIEIMIVLNLPAHNSSGYGREHWQNDEKGNISTREEIYLFPVREGCNQVIIVPI